MKHLSVILCAASLAAVCASRASAENIIYQQDPHAITQYAAISELDRYGINVIASDDFSLANSVTLGAIAWTGLHASGYQAVTAFIVTVSTDNGGAPGSAIFQDLISGNANETYDHSISDGGLSFDVDNYRVATNFGLQGNTKYWLSVVASVNSCCDWYWQESSQGNGSAYQVEGPSRGSYESDLAFTLFDNAVSPTNPTDPTPPTATTPEPGSLMLTGTGILSLAGALRRRFTRS